MDEDDQSDSAASDDDEDGSGTFANAYDESYLETVDVPL